MNCARERCRRWAFVFAKSLEATQHALPAMVLHQHNTEPLLPGSKAAPEFSLRQRGHSRLAHGLRGTAWAKPCFCFHAEPRS
jgi:hypothetical protein